MNHQFVEGQDAVVRAYDANLAIDRDLGVTLENLNYALRKIYASMVLVSTGTVLSGVISEHTTWKRVWCMALMLAAIVLPLLILMPDLINQRTTAPRGRTTKEHSTCSSHLEFNILKGPS